MKAKLFWVATALGLLVVSAGVWAGEFGTTGVSGEHASGPSTLLTPYVKPADLHLMPTAMRLPNGTVVPVPTFVGDDNPSGGTTPLQGMPAIVPMFNGAGPGQATYTKEDVIARCEAKRSGSPRNGLYSGGPFDSRTPVSIASIEFLTLGQMVARQPGIAAAQLPAEHMMCLVQYKGSFAEPLTPTGPTVFVPYAWEIFDGVTGNVYSQGEGPALKWCTQSIEALLSGTKNMGHSGNSE